MKKVLSFMVILVFSLLLCGANVASKVNVPQSVKLTYNPKAGSSTKYLLIVKAATTMEGVGKNTKAKPINSNTKVNATFTQKVDKIDKEGNIDMSFTYDDVSFEIEQGGEKATLPLGERVKGKATHVKISKDGKILDLRGPSDLPTEFKDFNLQKLYPQVNPAFPAGEIKIGDTWSQSVNETTPLSEGVSLIQKMKLDYVLKDITEIKGYKCAVIGVTTTMSITGKWEKKEQAKNAVGLESSGVGTGVMDYAYKTDKLIDSVMDMDVTSHMTIGSGVEAQESNIKQKLNINMEMVR
jgi:hypothetical protein